MTILIGVIVTALIYAQALVPNCGTPPSGGSPTTHGTIGTLMTIQGQSYWDLNVTFTAVDQSATLAQTSFQTTNFQDPTFPHLQGTSCITQASNPYIAAIHVTFSDGSSQTLSISYGGNPPTTADTQSFSTNHTPVAGIEWFQGTNCAQDTVNGCFLTLVVSQT